ncbi:hypothetical protein [Kitasatospora griseola]|uniref:hypothetical protein n=1 Tax=Kitasatospora griseola TaxID=2064 RepID=UPI0037FE2273
MTATHCAGQTGPASPPDCATAAPGTFPARRGQVELGSCAAEFGAASMPSAGPGRVQPAFATAMSGTGPAREGSAGPGGPEAGSAGVPTSPAGPGPAQRGFAAATVARACSRWDCSAEPVAVPQPDSGAAPTPSTESGRTRRQVVAGTCPRWDCLPEPTPPATEFVVAAPTLELVA